MEQETVKQVGIHFGMLCDPIATQLRQQKLKFDVKEINDIQQDIEAMDRLRFRLQLPDSICEKLRIKIHKNIVAHVAKKEKLKAKRQ